jgi:hypothetical protein
MITYNYKITKIQCIVKDDLLDYVKFVNYNMVAEESGISITVPMYACLPNVKTNSDFIPYENTTEQNIIDWCNAAIGEDWLNKIKSDVNDKLNGILTSQIPYEKDLIWV